MRRPTNGLGTSHILELWGPDTFDRSLRFLATGERIAQIGVFTGFGPQSSLIRPQMINRTINGINVGSGEQFDEMNTFIEAHRIKPVIDNTLAFESAQTAHDALTSGRHFGKLVDRL